MQRPLSIPGDGLLAPLPLLAVAVLVLNDHWLEAAWPGWFTGTLSEVAGLIVFPLLLQAGLELVQVRVGVPWAPSRRLLVGCVLITAGAFALVQVWAPVGELYRVGVAALGWPLRAMGGLTYEIAPVTSDPVDLVALPALAVPLLLGWRRASRFEESLEALPEGS